MRSAKSRAGQAKAISWQEAVVLPLAGLMLVSLIVLVQ